MLLIGYNDLRFVIDRLILFHSCWKLEETRHKISMNLKSRKINIIEQKHAFATTLVTAVSDLKS